MSNAKQLGKITHARFGTGGYQDAMIGLFLTFGGDGWGVCVSSDTTWDAETIKHSPNCKWSEADRDKTYASIVRFVSKTLKDAKVDSVEKLIGKPVEVEYNGTSPWGSTVKSWRILTEVL